jgi:SAM-dependent methyltransferase
MGTSIPEVLDVLAACGPDARPRRVLDIGAQNVFNCTPGQVTDFIRRFNDVWAGDDLAGYAEVFAAGSVYHVENGGICGAWLGDLLSRGGMDYIAYDLFDGPRTTIFDLNRDEVPPADRASYDLVINCGTTEHVFNQYNCFKVIHDATRVGGVMYHALPMTGYINHGYFVYTPVMFCDLAQVNEYEIIKIDVFGPQRVQQVSEALMPPPLQDARFRFNGVTSVADRWRDAPVPSGLVTIAMRRTSPAPFRVAIETRTTAGAVAATIQAAYGSQATPASDEAAGLLAVRRDSVDRWIRSVLDRFDDLTLTVQEIVNLYTEYVEAYPGRPFPPVIEKRALDLAIAADPERDDLKARRVIVEQLLAAQWPLLRFRGAIGNVDEQLLAVDGAEAAVLALPLDKQLFDHAVAAMQRYIAKGRPEAFPKMLEFRAWRYAADHLDPADWGLKLHLGKVTGKLSTDMVLRRASWIDG